MVQSWLDSLPPFSLVFWMMFDLRFFVQSILRLPILNPRQKLYTQLIPCSLWGISPVDLTLLDEFALRLLCLKSVGQFAAQLRPRPGLQYDLNSDLYSSLLAKPQLVVILLCWLIINLFIFRALFYLLVMLVLCIYDVLTQGSLHDYRPWANDESDGTQTSTIRNKGSRVLR